MNKYNVFVNFRICLIYIFLHWSIDSIGSMQYKSKSQWVFFLQVDKLTYNFITIWKYKLTIIAKAILKKEQSWMTSTMLF